MEFTAVAHLLGDGAALVRNHRERGETPTRDQRPASDAITRATATHHAATPPRPAATPPPATRSAGGGYGTGRSCWPPWRSTPRGDEAGTATALTSPPRRTLAGLGLDAGTVGAVTTAADLLTGAVHAARHIDAAAPVPVHRYRDVVAYPLGPVLAADLDTAGDTSPAPDTAAGNPRVLHIRRAVDGTRRLLLDTAGGPLSWSDDRADTSGRVTAWLPVPHQRHPWGRR